VSPPPVSLPDLLRRGRRRLANLPSAIPSAPTARPPQRSANAARGYNHGSF